MDFLKKFNLKPEELLKKAAIVFVVFIVIAFVLSLVGTSLGPLWSGNRVISISPTMGVSQSYDSVVYSGKEAYGESYGGSPAELSIRNAMPIYPMPGGTTGNTAEKFEVTDYSVFIETRDKKDTCAELLSMKSLEYVIFENANESSTNCSYTFKVEHTHLEEVLAKVKALDPKEISENSYTIQQQVSDFTSQIEILQKKKTSIDETLKNALRSYDEITAIATRNQDTASLAKIIDSKIQLIERLTQESININQQLEYFTRSKAEQLDRLDYTYFHVSVYENKYIDGEVLKDSWKMAIKNFVSTINRALQDATVNVLALFFILVPYIIYFFILLVVGKYVFRAARYIWNK